MFINDDHCSTSLGVNNSKIEKLEELNLEYNKKMNDALEKSRKYRRNGLCTTKDECNKYTHKLVSDIDKDYEKKLNKIMNFWQKKKYLEYRSIVY